MPLIDPTARPEPHPAAMAGERPPGFWRERYGRRAIGVALALALEALILLALLTLGRTGFAPAGEDSTVTTFDVRAAPDSDAPPQDPEEPPASAEPTSQRPREEPRQEESPRPPDRPSAATARPAPAPSPAPILPMSPDDLASADISNLPRRRPDTPSEAAPGPSYGPALPSSPGDSAVVGQAPNGEPLYAARWYREPTDGELRGYLSTASGPGWALIACRTAPQWRVEDCVGLEEYPPGSNLQRAVLAAAWQFQVRPPRKGDESLVGAWVRIRIDYRR